MGYKDIGMSSGSKNFFKIADREKVLVHVIGEEAGGPAEPKSYWHYFNQAAKRGVVVPDSYTGSVEKRAQHAFIVWSFRDNQPKVWSVGNNLAKQLHGLYESYDGSLATVDILVTRQGSGLETKYILAPKPTTFDASMLEGIDMPNLDEIFAENTDEEIENLKNGIVTQSDGYAEEAAPAANASEEGAEQETGGTAVATRPVHQAKTAVSVGDPRIMLVKAITHQFASNVKYKTPAARMAAIKSVAKGKTTLSQLSVAELKVLSGKLK